MNKRETSIEQEVSIKQESTTLTSVAQTARRTSPRGKRPATSAIDSAKKKARKSK